MSRPLQINFGGNAVPSQLTGSAPNQVREYNIPAQAARSCGSTDVDATGFADQAAFDAAMSAALGDYPAGERRHDVYITMGNTSFSLDAWLSSLDAPDDGELRVHNIGPDDPATGNLSYTDPKTNEVLNYPGIVAGSGHGMLCLDGCGGNWIH